MTALQATRPLECNHGLRRRAIVSSLLSDIFLGRLVSGQHLITRPLADRFGVSHTPIREALIELAGIGMIDLLPNRGAVVRKVTPRDVREVCQVRRSLECEAVRGACGRIERSVLEAIRADLDKLIGEWSPHATHLIEQARALDSRLHDTIAGSCGNAFLANEINRLKILFRTFRDVSWERDQVLTDLHRIVDESREHMTIIDALIAGKRREARIAMSRHVMAGAGYWSVALDVAAGDASVKPRSVRVSRKEQP